ncbi:carbohydrate ABC transporter permease [Amycolatopsis sp. 195334CR]|uniref:carbohydrate ABC transporter permease n=1 Tax=Amycolatopsis sp. 195334CR TaxID=2814588 RepID=UPI001A8F03A4|nr:carbohydrate ABC transporter permease [Amycolatopsis sp. 195334CR]MBN6041960.1 carbohydrate ABC transporter permease [Amycolatopsis sp. 195334CR]
MTLTTSRPAPAGRPKVAKLGRPNFFVYATLAVFVLGSLFPFYWSFLVASRDSGMLTERVPPLLPGGNFFANAAEVFDSVAFWKSLGNSVLVATSVTLTTVLFSSLAGFAFAKLRFRGRDPLFVFIVVTLAVPTQLGVIPLFIAMSELGWAGGLQAVIVPNLVTAFGVFWMRQYTVDAVPYELVEAARMDGCSMIRIFWHVCLPAVRPAAAVLAMFTFMTSWNDFLWPLIVLDAGNPTVQLALEQLQSGYYTNYSLVLAGTTLATIPILIVFLLLGRQIVAGIMQGAVKG